MYKVFTKFNVVLFVLGLLIFVLGICIFLFGEASRVGLVISIVSCSILSTILLITSILDIVKRIKNKLSLVGVRGSILFLNKTSYKNSEIKKIMEIVPLNIDKKVVQDLQDALDSPLGLSLRMSNYGEPDSRAIKLKYYDPFTYVKFKDLNTVIIKLGNKEKKVAGRQLGEYIEVEYMRSSEHALVSLIEHELGHRLLSEAYAHSSTEWQHSIMAISENTNKNP